MTSGAGFGGGGGWEREGEVGKGLPFVRGREGKRERGNPAPRSWHLEPITDGKKGKFMLGRWEAQGPIQPAVPPCPEQ